MWKSLETAYESVSIRLVDHTNTLALHQKELFGFNLKFCAIISTHIVGLLLTRWFACSVYWKEKISFFFICSTLSICSTGYSKSITSPKIIETEMLQVCRSVEKQNRNQSVFIQKRYQKEYSSIIYSFMLSKPNLSVIHVVSKTQMIDLWALG